MNGEGVRQTAEVGPSKLGWEREWRGVDGGDSIGMDGIGDDDSDEIPVQSLARSVDASSP
jgi:hypothetical protein